MMSFQDAVRTCFQKYVVISGRAQRSEYWWFVLFTTIASIILAILDGAAFGFGENAPSVLQPLFSLAVLLPTICVAGRRLHDRDMSAWWLLLMLLPALGALILLVLYVMRGTDGPNRFGPDPLASGMSQAHDDAVYSQSSIPRSGRDD